MSAGMSRAMARVRDAGAELVVFAVAMAGPIAFSIWPRVRELLAADAPADHPNVPLLVVLVVCLFGMCCTAKALAKAETRPQWWFFLAVYICLALVTSSRSLEPATALREVAAAPAKDAAGRVADLTSRIDAAQASRKSLPQFTVTTVEMVAAAAEASRLATATRELECSPRKGGSGPQCATDKAAERAAQEAHGKALANKALTDRAKDLEDQIAKWKAERSKIPMPEHADLSAAKWAQIVRLRVETVREWEPVLLIMLIEFVLPIGLSSLLRQAFGLSGSPQPVPGRCWSWPNLPAWRRRQAPVATRAELPVALPSEPVVAPAAPAPAPERPAARPAATLETNAGSRLPHAAAEASATPAKPKNVHKIKLPQVREVGDVREWYAACCLARPGNRIRCKEEAYKPYRKWCEDRGKEPENFARFNEIVKGIAGIASEYDEKGKRGFYVGFAVVGSGLRLVANNSPRQMPTLATA